MGRRKEGEMETPLETATAVAAAAVVVQVVGEATADIASRKACRHGTN